MTESETVFNNATARKSYLLAKNLQNNKKLEDKIWDTFCQKQNDNKEKEIKVKSKQSNRFRSHPKLLASDSELSFSTTTSFINANYNQNCDASETHSEISVKSVKFSNENSYSVRESSCATKHATSKINRVSSHTHLKNELKKLDSNLQQSLAIRDKLTHKKSIGKTDAIPLAVRETELSKANKSIKNNEFYKTILKTESARTISHKTQETYYHPISNRELPKSKANMQTTDSSLASSDKAMQNLIEFTNIDLKLKKILQKSLTAMDHIDETLKTGISPPDGKEDYERRRKRAVEFAARFSRNYLYQLGRQINELKKLSKPSGRKLSHANVFYQRLVASHQIILQALQAYHRHMPTSIVNSATDKLQELLNQSVNLCEVCKVQLNIGTPSNKDRKCIANLREFETSCKTLVIKLKENSVIVSSSTLGAHSRLSMVGYNINPVKKCKQLLHKNSLESRLSMYSIPVSFPKDPKWKKAVAVLAKEKLRYCNVKSKYRTALYKHRPPMEKTNSLQSTNKLKLSEKRLSGIIKHTPIPLPLDEDQITTMVEIQKKKDEQNNNGEVPCTSSTWPSGKGIKNGNAQPLVEGQTGEGSKEQNAMTQEQLELVLQNLLGMVRGGDAKTNGVTGSGRNGFATAAIDPDKAPHDLGGEKNMARGNVDANFCASLAKKLMVLAQKENKMLVNGDTAAEDAAEHKVNRKKTLDKRKQTVTVTGEKNAQLICIRDDNSIWETSEELNTSQINSTRQNRSCEVTNHKHTAKPEIMIDLRPKNVPSTSNHRTVGQSVCSEKSSQRSVKIYRLPRPTLRKLTMLSKNETIGAIQYKLEFHKYARKHHMYRKSSKNQPCEVVGRMSDKLLEDLLEAVVEELHMNGVLNSMYASEFQ